MGEKIPGILRSAFKILGGMATTASGEVAVMEWPSLFLAWAFTKYRHAAALLACSPTSGHCTM